MTFTSSRSILAAAALTGAAVFGAVAPASAAAKPQTVYEVCDYLVTASGLYIHSGPSTSSTDIGETFKGYVFVHISDESGETNGFIYGSSNGDTGWASAAYLAADGCHSVTD